MKKDDTWTIGELSEQTSCKVETIRFYERIDLMPSPPRTSGGHRIYGLEHLKRLTFIRGCRELGFTVEELRELLALIDGGAYTCSEVKQVVLQHLAEVQRRLKALKAMEGVLKQMADNCSGDTIPNCPFIDTMYGLHQV